MARTRSRSGVLSWSGLGVVAAVAALVLLPAASASAVSTDVPTGDFPQMVAISPDGTRAYATIAVAGATPASNGRLDVIDTATDEILAQIPLGGREPRDVVVSPDGTRVYVAVMLTNQVVVVDTATNAIISAWDVPGDPVGEGAWGLAVSGDGSTLYVSVRGGDRVEAIDTADGTSAGTLPAPNLPAGVVVDSDDHYLYVARSATDLVRRIDLTNPSSIVDLDLDPAVGGPSPFLLTLSPDGSELWVAPFSGSDVYVVPTSTFASATAIDVGATPRRVGFDGTGRVYVPVDAADSGSVAVFGTAPSHAPVGSTVVGGAPQDVAFLPDGTHAYTANLFGGGLSFIGPPLPAAPAPQTVVEGDTASFTASVRATWDTIQWQVQAPGGGTWTDVPSGTGPTLTVDTALADNGAHYRYVATSTLFGSATSAAALLTVTAAPLPPTGVEVASSLAAAAALVLAGLALTLRARRVRRS